MDKERALARLRQSIDYLKDNGKARKHEEIAKLTGISRPHVSAAINGDFSRITEKNLRRFAAAYSDYINENWLLTGEGEMEVPDKTMRPHFDAKASAGFMCGVGEAETGTLRPRIPGMKDYDFTIEADGNSMLPRIVSGDLLVCRKADDRANPPIGKICVIDGKDGAAVKVIASANDDSETVTLHSLNPDYPDYDVEFSDILDIAEVVGLVRRF